MATPLMTSSQNFRSKRSKPSQERLTTNQSPQWCKPCMAMQFLSPHHQEEEPMVILDLSCLPPYIQHSLQLPTWCPSVLESYRLFPIDHPLKLSSKSSANTRRKIVASMITTETWTTISRVKSLTPSKILTSVDSETSTRGILESAPEIYSIISSIDMEKSTKPISKQTRAE